MASPLINFIKNNDTINALDDIARGNSAPGQVDANGKTVPVPELIPESELEKKLFDGALRRRQLRLVLAGKMKANDATELKALFLNQSEL